MPIAKETLAKHTNPVFVETGTYMGATVQKALELGFEKIISIEIDEQLYQKACQKFARRPAVELICGDTLERLPHILADLAQPATFWLDAHRGPGPGGDVPYPIMKELELIANHPIKTHTILIDDRRLLDDKWGLTEADVRIALLKINPNYQISYEPGFVEDDVIVAKVSSNSNLANAETYHKLGETFSEQKNWHEAVIAYQQAIEIHPNFSWSYHKLGEAFSQLQKWNEAVAAYLRATETNPDFPWSYHKLGEALTKLQRWDEAVVAYRKFIDKNPDFPWVYNKLGEALIQLKRWEEVVACYNHFIKLQPTLPESYRKLGEALMQLEKWSEATDAYRQAIKLNPNLYSDYQNLGECLTNLEKWSEAAEVYQKAINLNPSNYWNYNKLGDVFNRLKKYDEALEVYQKAIEIKPNLYFAYHNTGQTLFKLERLDEAVKSYRQAIKANPNSYWSYHNLGQVLVQLKSWQEAEEVYTKAIEINPNNYDDYYELGKALKKQGLIDKSIAAYKKAISLKPDFYGLYVVLGNTALEKGQFEEAIASFIKAIELQPDLPEVYEKLRGMNTFSLFSLQPTHFDRLAKCYEKAIEARPNLTEPYINLGDILSKRGQVEKAINCYQKASYQKLLESRPELAENKEKTEKFSKPNFIIFGTVKGGTTSLYNYLTLHPSILPAIQKEVHFFNRNHIFRQGLKWYLAHFPQIPQNLNLISGEASPNYMYFPQAGKRVFQCLPEVKLILILRNPIDRAISHYYMARRLGQEQRSLEEALAGEVKTIKNIPQRAFDEVNFFTEPPTYLRAGFYFYFIKEWMNVFPREQVLVLKSEEMYENPAATMKQVFEFLAVPNYQLSEYKNYFYGSYSRQEEEIRNSLSELLKPHNQRLEDYLGMQFNWE